MAWGLPSVRAPVYPLMAQYSQYPVPAAFYPAAFHTLAPILDAHSASSALLLERGWPAPLGLAHLYGAYMLIIIISMLCLFCFLS